MRVERNTNIKINSSADRFFRMLCLLLAVMMLAAVFGGCRKRDDGEQMGAGDGQNTLENPAFRAESDGSDSGEQEKGIREDADASKTTEEMTEKQTESSYNEDGSRRAWITVEGRLNVREKADASSQFIGSFPARQEIRVLDEKAEKGFYKVGGKDYITGQDITGYASEKYISFDPPEAPQVRLDVVSWLQTDERWSDVLLGSTKKTMYDIGCATTALAMSETFLKKKEIYPDELAKDAVYTSDGEIGWPKDYYWNYNKDMYLDFVYNKLHEGIPVLIGCARYNGRPHWVLITGYVGDGGTLKAKDFLINDPLPYGRTNLQQYLDEYPVFNKLIYYCKDRALVPGSEESEAAEKEKGTETSKETETN